ncbi:unnamed protein product [Staurois parvus]|uniref:Uncharacterized protein n=1 Tax=Staurois parvus TaxID=386267 RepID=A0ABN9E5R0_9NEOB|nr:unnamed protein product [Staurois parvus]
MYPCSQGQTDHSGTAEGPILSRGPHDSFQWNLPINQRPECGRGHRGLHDLLFSRGPSELSVRPACSIIFE